MSNIFAGLEDLGFKNVEKVDVYQERKKTCFLTRATPVRYATMNLRAVW